MRAERKKNTKNFFKIQWAALFHVIVGYSECNVLHLFHAVSFPRLTGVSYFVVLNCITSKEVRQSAKLDDFICFSHRFLWEYQQWNEADKAISIMSLNLRWFFFVNGATYFRKSLRGKSRWQSLLPHQISFAQFCRVAIYLCPFFFFFLHFVWYHWWLWRARASLTRRHICTHFCEHLALNCAVTLSTSGTGIFCLSCDIWLFGQTSKPCASLHASAPTARTHTRITLTEPFLLNTHPSIQPHTHTHTHTHTLMWILSAVLSWGFRPVRSPRRSGDQGRKSLSRPQAPPSAPCLGSGSWEADAMQAPSVACFCGQSI